MHALVATARPMGDNQRGARKENRSNKLRLCLEAVMATSLNSGHAEKAATVRSHGADHAGDLPTGRYRQGCLPAARRGRQWPQVRLYNMEYVVVTCDRRAGRCSSSGTTPCRSSPCKRSLFGLFGPASDASHPACLSCSAGGITPS